MERQQKDGSIMEERKMKEKLYIAYGSNLNLNQMAMRCPDAMPVGTAMLDGWQLTFRGVATLEIVEGATAPVGIWRITERCEKALDRYEGYPTLYRKENIEIEHNGNKVEAMIYLMNTGLPCMPSRHYLQTIEEGYYDIGLDTVHLRKALEHTKERMQER